MQTWIGGYTTPLLGIVLASVLFGLVHFSGIAHVLLTALMGLILGFSYEWTQSLYLVMAWHTAYDICGLGVIAKYPHLVADVTPQEDLR